MMNWGLKCLLFLISYVSYVFIVLKGLTNKLWSGLYTRRWLSSLSLKKRGILQLPSRSNSVSLFGNMVALIEIMAIYLVYIITKLGKLLSSGMYRAFTFIFILTRPCCPSWYRLVVIFCLCISRDMREIEIVICNVNALLWGAVNSVSK